MSRLDRLAQLLQEEGGSSLHVSAKAPVRARVEGRLVRLEVATLNAEELAEEIVDLAGASLWAEIERGHPVDFPCELNGDRFRAHAFTRHDGISLVLRATADLAGFDQLGLPKTVQRLAHLRRGLVLVAGPSGSGKSTTVGALLKEVDEGRPKHIVTIEDPIELVFRHQRASVAQREVGPHAESFEGALRAAIRQGADVLYISEIPDAGAMTRVIDAAAAGMLVIATVRGSGAVRAIERLVDDEKRRRALLNGLAEHLSAVVSQIRLQRADGKGHVVAAELLMRSRGVVTALREDTLDDLPAIMQESDAMQSLDDALAGLLERQRIAFEDAYDHARDKQRFVALRPGARRVMRRTRKHE